MFKNFNTGTKLGLVIMLLTGLAMVFLILTGKPVYDITAMSFLVGMIITLVSSFYNRKTRCKQESVNR